METLKNLMANINDVNTLKEVMAILKGELENSTKEFAERLKALQITSPNDFNSLKERLSKHSLII